MASDELKQIFSVEAVGLEGLKALDAAVRKYDLTLEDVESVQQTLTKSGKVLAQNITFLTKEGDKYDIVLKRVHKNVGILTVAQEKFTKALSRTATEKKKVKQGITQLIALEKTAAKFEQAKINNARRATEATKRSEKIRIASVRRTVEILKNAERERIAGIRRIEAQETAALIQRERQAARFERSRLAGIDRAAASERRRRQELDRTVDQFVRFARAANKAGKEGERAGRIVTITWRGVARLFAVQVFHRIFARISAAMNEARRESNEYSRAIGEIRAIQADIVSSTEEWNIALKVLTESFGTTQLDAAEAAYQAISNQIIQTADQTDFLIEANKLAIATNSSLTDSVNALSSILNSYSLDATHAAEAGTVLFRTVEQGRVRLGELSNTIGNVSILTAQVGVTMQETGAAIAVLSRAGVSATRAQTLLRAVMLALIKPSEAMSDALEQIGRSSGPAAIETFGLIGTLARLAETSTVGEDALTNLTKIFGRLRGVVGAAGLPVEKLTEVLEEFVEGTTTVEQAANRVADTIGFRWEKELARATVNFRIFFETIQPWITDTVHLMNTLFEGLNRDPKQQGIIDDFIKRGKVPSLGELQRNTEITGLRINEEGKLEIVTVLKQITEIQDAIANAELISGTLLGGVGAKLGGKPGAVVGLGSSVVLSRAGGDLATIAASLIAQRKLTKEEEERIERQTKLRKLQEQLTIQNAEDEVNEAVNIQQRRNAALLVLWGEYGKGVEKSQKVLGVIIKTIFTDIFKDIDNQIRESQQKITELIRNADRLLADRNKLSREIADREFENKINVLGGGALTEREQIDAILDRADVVGGEQGIKRREEGIRRAARLAETSGQKIEQLTEKRIRLAERELELRERFNNATTQEQVDRIRIKGQKVIDEGLEAERELAELRKDLPELQDIVNIGNEDQLTAMKELRDILEEQEEIEREKVVTERKKLDQLKERRAILKDIVNDLIKFDPKQEDAPDQFNALINQLERAAKVLGVDISGLLPDLAQQAALLAQEGLRATAMEELNIAENILRATQKGNAKDRTEEIARQIRELDALRQAHANILTQQGEVIPPLVPIKPTELGFAHGGYVGQGPPGIDTVPARLTVGEYVWDKATTDRFLPLIRGLHDMSNRGFQSGGPVTNLSFGDINVTGSDGTPRATARLILQEIRRETRRGIGV